MSAKPTYEELLSRCQQAEEMLRAIRSDQSETTDEGRGITIELMRLLSQSNDLHGLMANVTRLMRHWSGCEAVGIRLCRGEDFPYFETRGFPEQFVQAENNLCAVDPKGDPIRDSQGNPVLECMCGNVISGRFDPRLPFFTVNGSFWTNSTTKLLAATSEQDRQSRTRNRCHGEGFESVALIPLRHGGNTLGLLQFNDCRPDRFTSAKITLLERLASNLAIVHKERMTAQALKESEAKYRLFVEMAREGFWAMDSQNRTTFTNRRMAEMLGYEPEEMIGKPVEAFMFEQDLSDHRAKMALRKQGQGNTYERRFHHRNGSQVWAQVSATAIMSPQGQFAGSYALFTDITERKKAENALRDSEEKYRLTFESITDSITVTKIEDGRYLYVNDGFCNQTGYSRQEVIGKTPSDIRLYADPNQRERFIGILKTKGCARDVMVRFRRKNGQLYYSEFSAKPLEYEGEACLLAQSRDVTDRVLAEEALRASEDNLRSLFNAISESVCLIERNGKVLTANETFAKRLGKGVNDCIGQSVYSLIPADVAARRKTIVEEVIRSGQPAQLEDERLGRCLYHSIFPVLDANGAVDRLAVYAIDMTERKQAEQKLRESRELLTVTEQLAKAGGWEWDVAQQKMTWTDETYRIHGLTPGKIVAGSPEHIERSLACYAPDDRPIIKAAFQRCASTGEPYNLEFPLTTADGRRVWIQTIAEAVLEGNRVVKVRGHIVDITESKRAETALRESEERLQAIFESNANPIVVYDAEGFPQYLNPAFTELFGWTLDELRGRRIPFVPDDQKEITTAKIAEIYASKNPVKFLSSRTTKWGTTIDVIISAAIIKGATGRGAGMVVNLTDISEQRKLERQLRQAQKMESVGRLAGGVAHDFNNMLSVIIGNTELAMDNVPPDGPFHDALQEIYSAARRSADITRQLLAFARKQTIAPKVLDLNETVEGMLKMLRRLIGEDIDLSWLPVTNVWPVRMDPSQLDQILANLCVNARDAIEGVGKITIETDKASFDETYCAEHPGFLPGDFVLLSFSDDGCGMDRNILDNLFEPFFTTKGVDKGTGLGLATVYGIVKQNNGFINVHSQPRQGSTFKIYLPRHEVTAEKIRKKDAVAPDGRGNETILLVEDEPAILRMTKMILQRLGYTVLAANTPGESISLASKHAGDIHLLITDVVMPEMNGRDLASTLLPLYPKLKRLFMSGYTANVIAHHGVLDEGVQFIQKPFRKQDLAIKVRKVLDEAID